MSPEAQRIAIQEWYWKRQGLMHWINTDSSYSEETIRCMKDWTNDLNAMHEAEEMLNYVQLRAVEGSVSFLFGALPFHATAAQRAEAFLKTIGKWEDGK